MTTTIMAYYNTVIEIFYSVTFSLNYSTKHDDLFCKHQATAASLKAKNESANLATTTLFVGLLSELAWEELLLLLNPLSDEESPRPRLATSAEPVKITCFSSNLIGWSKFSTHLQSNRSRLRCNCSKVCWKHLMTSELLLFPAWKAIAESRVEKGKKIVERRAFNDGW